MWPFTFGRKRRDKLARQVEGVKRNQAIRGKTGGSVQPEPGRRGGDHKRGKK